MYKGKKTVSPKSPNLCTQVAVFIWIQQNENVLDNVPSCK